MMLIVLAGPMACGKTMTHKILREHMAKIEEATGHRIEVVERIDDQLHEALFDAPPVPVFRAMRFKASGKWVDSFPIVVPGATTMQHVSDYVRKARPLNGGSIVVYEALTQPAEDFFYPVEVK